MTEHLCTVTWSRGGAPTANHRYSRRHTWQFDGGQQVLASSSPHVVPVPLSDEAGVDPEEAFVASLSSCHMLWFLDVATRAGWVVTHYRDAAVGLMGRNAQEQLAMTRVTLRPAAQFAGAEPTDAELKTLHHQAHDACFIANSVKSEVVCEPQPWV